MTANSDLFSSRIDFFRMQIVVILKFHTNPDILPLKWSAREPGSLCSNHDISSVGRLFFVAFEAPFCSFPSDSLILAFLCLFVLNYYKDS